MGGGADALSSRSISPINASTSSSCPPRHHIIATTNNDDGAATQSAHGEVRSDRDRWFGQAPRTARVSRHCIGPTRRQLTTPPPPPPPDRRKQQLNQLSPVDSRSPRPSAPPPATPLRRHHHDSPPRPIRPITRTPDLELLEALLDDRVLVLLQLLRVRHVLRDPRATHTRNSSAASNSPDATRAPSTRPARARRFPVNDRKNIDAVRLGSRPLETTTSHKARLYRREEPKQDEWRWQTETKTHTRAGGRHRCK